MNIKQHKIINCFNATYTQTTELNHGIHGYPAKFPPQIPQLLLTEFAKDNYTILDPFCGSGTTLVEAKLKNLNAVGNDINPVALLLAKVKTTTYLDEDLELYNLVIDYIYNDFLIHPLASIENYDAKRDFHGRDHWFQKNVQFEIELILNHIEQCDNEKVQDLLKVTLSDILISVSNQESDTRYAAKAKNIASGFTINKFVKKAKLIEERIREFSQITFENKSNINIISNDARELTDIADGSIDMIITSPPYANTYDYYLYHKHRMNWLGFNFKETQNIEIGSRHEFSSKKQEALKWEDDLNKVLQQMQRVLKSDRYAFIVIGDSVINKQLIHIDEVIKSLSILSGFEIINIESTQLSKNSRKFNKKFGTDKEKFEHLIQIYKP